MGDESFRVEVVNANGRAIVSLHGEIDMNCGPALRDALSAAQHGSPDVIVDLSGVTFMDSTGLHALIGAYYQRAGGRHPRGGGPYIGHPQGLRHHRAVGNALASAPAPDLATSDLQP